MGDREEREECWFERVLGLLRWIRGVEDQIGKQLLSVSGLG